MSGEGFGVIFFRGGEATAGGVCRGRGALAGGALTAVGADGRITTGWGGVACGGEAQPLKRISGPKTTMRTLRVKGYILSWG